MDKFWWSKGERLKTLRNVYRYEGVIPLRCDAAKLLSVLEKSENLECLDNVLEKMSTLLKELKNYRFVISEVQRALSHEDEEEDKEE